MGKHPIRLFVGLAAVLTGVAVPTAQAATSAPKPNSACKASEVGTTKSGLTCQKNAKGKTVWTTATTTTAAAATTTKAPAATAAPAATGAKSGGKMVFAIEAETSGGWTPSAVQWAMASNLVRGTMIENLVMPNAAGGPQCYLCESITGSGKYDEWTIKLRKGIKFHNGEAFDATAVKANLDDLRKTGAVTAALFRPITAVEVVDASTVKISLNGSFVNFPAVLVNQQSAMVAPAQLKDAQGRNKPIGTGPYVFKEWKVNDSLTVTKNKDYWRKDYGFLDEITFKVITEETARVTAFKSGAVQGMHTVNPLKIAELKDLEKSKKASLLEINKNPGINNILFNMATGPTADKRVREALALATDRVALNEINNAGILKIIDVPFVPGDASKLTGLYPSPNVDKAKALIADVVKSTGKPVEITLGTSAVPENIESAQTIQQLWEKTGVKVKIVAAEQAAYVRQIQTGDFQAGTFRFQSALDPEDLRRQFHSESALPIGTATSNYMRWKNGIVDAAFDQLRSSSDPVVRKRAADTISGELINDWPMIITAATTWGVAVNSDFQMGTPTLPDGKEWQSSPTGAFPLGFISQR